MSLRDPRAYRYHHLSRREKDGELEFSLIVLLCLSCVIGGMLIGGTLAIEMHDARALTSADVEAH